MIVIGACSSAMQALRTVLRALPADFPDALAIIVQRQESDETLTQSLQESSALPVCEIVDKQPIEAGTVYVAPPDYHTLIDEDHFSLSIDEPVHRARPSIDVLFESAAVAGYKDLIGVILTREGDDGASGAAVIEAAGGKVLIQSPHRALTGTTHAEVHELAGLTQRIVELVTAHRHRRTLEV
jgi:two-component system, chemotaxis family, protein-glutamate methylesterase/glutaminase